MFRRILFASAAAVLLALPKGTSAAAPTTLQGTVSPAKEGGGLIVYVVNAPGAFAPSKVDPVMNQKGMKFEPHVLTVVVGTTVDFENSDSVSHNVFSPDGEGYNLGTWAKNAKRSYTFKHPGIYTQLCSIHPEMEAYVIVLQNPYYATTSADGHFKIDGLPPGHYELKVWGEHLKAKDMKTAFPVDVAATGATTTITLGS